MANSSFLGGTPQPEDIAGKDVQALGPSDNSDSGSDTVGAYGDAELHSDTDAAGTGERASVDEFPGLSGADILPDTIADSGGDAGGIASLDTAAAGDAPTDDEAAEAVSELAGDSSAGAANARRDAAQADLDEASDSDQNPA